MKMKMMTLTMMTMQSNQAEKQNLQVDTGRPRINYSSMHAAFQSVWLLLVHALVFA